MTFRFLLISFFCMAYASFAGAQTTKKNKKNKTTSATAAQPEKTVAVPTYAPKAPNYSYQPSYTRVHDLLDTRLDVRFNWQNRQLIGKAWLTLKPHVSTTDAITLDAKAFDIHRVALDNGGTLTDLPYDYDSLRLNIRLGRKITPSENFVLYIEYTANPEKVKSEGSSAITAAKGLYFINHDNRDPQKPQQIWTQGETESNSCWFPTIDSPNERTTQEMFITVDKKFVTLSNGKLLASKENSDGTRTDHWKQTLPHAPYLFMMAVGPFAVVQDAPWRGREVSYYVEPEYEKYAKTVFGNTPEMLEFFSNRLGVEYPWEKFSQVVVRDFVSGAMENTTAVIHFGGLQHDDREHLDNTLEDIVAHELFHHWFGDLVTCESWSNLPLNESFATYGEYLWAEHKYGPDEAAYTLKGFLNSYLGESRMKREQLIRYQYNDKEDMFDGHSYSKGGRVLHMLRKLTGDDAFFAAIKQYLERNKFSDVEIHELRLAFEDVTGQDLNWFFEQWFLSPGHPELKVDYLWDQTQNKLTVMVKQTQDLRYFPVFRLPVEVETYANGKTQRHSFWLTGKDTLFTIALEAAPLYVSFDPDKALLADIRETRKRDEYLPQLKYAKGYMLRTEALEELTEGFYASDEILKAVIESASDPYWGTRRTALNKFELYNGSNPAPALEAACRIAASDKSAPVRSAAVSVIAELISKVQDPALRSTAAATLEKTSSDSSYNVQRGSLIALYALDKAKGLEKARMLMRDAGDKIAPAVADILIESKAEEATSFISGRIQKMDNGWDKAEMISQLGSCMKTASEKDKAGGVKTLIEEMKNNPSGWMRGSCVRALAGFVDRQDVSAFLKEWLPKEENENVRELIEDLFK